MWIRDRYNGNSWKRTNGKGVDLNRNYPIGWDESCAGQSQSGGETFRGPEPFSEVETQTMRAFQQDKNFAKVMDFHSYGGESRTNYGPCSALPKPIDGMFVQYNADIASRMSYDSSRSCCMGGDIHYAFNRHGSMAYLVETGDAFQPDAATKDKVVEQVWPGVKHFLEIPIPLSGKVIDKESGNVVPGAKIEVPGYTWNLNERRQSGKDGLYHLWLPEGDHKIVVTRPSGKNGQEFTLAAKKGGTIHNIEI
eukprot:TRINITY_DN15993_c0_g1_i1.p1 TRINITY_DN15993_c0_g1~~TRINITY_DN15993_c0_g1_i1.p1  ORF type:complete len:251 (+),score=23.32 TRINITY_DN15993_c0_g1_i1:101-853(+)